MKFKIDHDLHIHSRHSLCSGNPLQTPENILNYAKENNLNTICLTDHYWDPAVEGGSDWYMAQTDVDVMKPLPQSENCKFLFGCETDMDKNFKIGLSKQRMEELDFIIVPTTHLHMTGFTFESSQNSVADKTELYVKRFEAFLNADLPFHKVGLAHITCSLIHREEDGFLKVLNGVSDNTFEKLFGGCAEKGCGVELNIALKNLDDEEKMKTIIRPYQIAKSQGCKFYLGSDSHNPQGLKAAMERFRKMIDFLDLTEEDKFHIG